jgi:hypothetical protein
MIPASVPQTQGCVAQLLNITQQRDFIIQA